MSTGGQISLRISAEEGQALAALGRLVQATDNVAQSAKRGSEANRQAAAEARKLAAEAAKITEGNLQPLERYNRDLQRADKAYKDARISAETYRREVDRLGKEYMENERAAKGVDQAQDGAFGASALQAAVQYASGLMGISAAAGMITQAFRDMEEARKEAAAAATFARLEIGSLAQLAESPEEMKSLITKTEQVYEQGGAADMNEAARVVFAAKSAGALEDIDVVTQMKASGLIATPDTMMKAAATLMTSMGREETGSIREIISKAFGAAREAPGTMEAVIEAASKGGTTAAALGLSDEELLAATAITAKAAGTEEQGGTQVASLLRSLTEIRATRPEMAGQDLMGMLNTIKQMQLPEEQLQTLMGRHEALTAYRVLMQNEGMMADLTQETRAAQQRDEIGLRLKLHEVDPSLVAARRAQEAKAQEMSSRKMLGELENESQAVLDRATAKAREQGSPEILIQTGRRAESIIRGRTGVSAIPGGRAAGGVLKAAASIFGRRWPGLAGDEQEVQEAEVDEAQVPLPVQPRPQPLPMPTPRRPVLPMAELGADAPMGLIRPQARPPVQEAGFAPQSPAAWGTEVEPWQGQPRQAVAPFGPMQGRGQQPQMPQRERELVEVGAPAVNVSVQPPRDAFGAQMVDLLGDVVTETRNVRRELQTAAQAARQAQQAGRGRLGDPDRDR